MSAGEVITVRCAVGGCDWPGFTGTIDLARAEAENHRAESHEWVKPGRVHTEETRPPLTLVDAIADDAEPDVEVEPVSAVVSAETLERNYRLQDRDGLFGCKTSGCSGRSRSSAGPYAYKCDSCRGVREEPDGWTLERAVRAVQGFEATYGRLPGIRDLGQDELPSRVTLQSTLETSFGDLVEAAGFPRPTRGRASRDLAVSPDPPPTKRDVVFEPPPLGLTGDFSGQSRHARTEADRLRRQAIALDHIAAGIDELEETL